MISDNWIKFSIGVAVLFGVIFLYSLSSPEIRAYLGNTSIITTFIGIFSLGFFLFGQIKQNKIQESSTLPKSGAIKAGMIFFKICMVFVTFIIVYLLYILAKGAF